MHSILRCASDTTVFFDAVTDHSSIGLGEAACPEAGGLARDERRAECTLSAMPVPGTETTVQNQRLTGRNTVGWVGRSVFLTWFMSEV